MKRNTSPQLEEMGGWETLERVHKILYDKLFTHPWLKGFFAGKSQEHLENQQTDFMASMFGVKDAYSGRFPIDAHCHMFITDEVFMVRHQLLHQSLMQAGVSEENLRRWLEKDASFQHSMVKTSVDECKKRYNTDTIIVVPEP